MKQDNQITDLLVPDIHDVMVLKQLPQIEQRLASVKDILEKRIEAALNLVYSGGSLKELKESRAQIRKEFEQFETGRKQIKEQIFAPYKNFEAIYGECISEAYQRADTQFKNRIDAMESKMKQEKQREAEGYFQEYAAYLGIDFIPFERMGLKINLSVSMKSLKDGIKAFLDGVKEDMEMISLQEHREEILVEYKDSLNASQAIHAVILRHEAMEREKAQLEQPEQEDVLHTPKADILPPPVAEDAEEAPLYSDEEAAEPKTTAEAAVQDENDPVLELTFTVRAAKSKLKALKAFLIEGGYEVG